MFQEQDIVRCHLCNNPVEHHCNLCHFNLCFICVPKHMADKSKDHEIVEFKNRKEGPILSHCLTHPQTLCEMYCNDCEEAVCSFCVTSAHRKHNFDNITSTVDCFKQRIIADVIELEHFITPKYRYVSAGVPATIEFDRAIRDIQVQEDKLCKIVREVGRHFKDKIIMQRKELERRNKEVQLSAAKSQRNIKELIQSHRQILRSDYVSAILSYRSRNEEFRHGPRQVDHSLPTFMPEIVKVDQILKIFGTFQNRSGTISKKQPGLSELLEYPTVTAIIRRYHFGQKLKLFKVICDRTDKLWVSVSGRKILQIDRQGSTLKTINTGHDVLTLSFNIRQELVFSVLWPDTKIYKYEGKNVTTMLDISPWCSVGVNHTVNGDLIVSMRSLHKTHSRVVRYRGTTEAEVIQSDRRGKLLFSIGTCNADTLFLTENGNRDICVADHAGAAVVVVNYSGGLRFKYQGHPPADSPLNLFKPRHIATDINHQILVNDSSNNILHIIDCNGNFIRYIEHPCNAGVSVDSEHHVVVGDYNTGDILVIKYLE